MNSVEENFVRFIDPGPLSSDDEEEGEDDKNGDGEEVAEMDEEEDDNATNDVEHAAGEEERESEAVVEKKGELEENEEEEEEDVGEGKKVTPSEHFDDSTDAKEAEEKDSEEDAEKKGEDQNAKDDATLASAEESLCELLNKKETELCEAPSIPEKTATPSVRYSPLHPPPSPRNTLSRSLTLSILLAVTPTDLIALDHIVNREDPHLWKPPATSPSIDNRLQDLQQEVQRRLHQQAIQQPHYWTSHDHLFGIRFCLFSCSGNSSFILSLSLLTSPLSSLFFSWFLPLLALSVIFICMFRVWMF